MEPAERESDEFSADRCDVRGGRGRAAARALAVGVRRHRAANASAALARCIHRHKLAYTLAMVVEHAITIRDLRLRYGAPEVFAAQCSCGWLGEERRSRAGRARPCRTAGTTSIGRTSSRVVQDGTWLARDVADLLSGYPPAAAISVARDLCHAVRSSSPLQTRPAARVTHGRIQIGRRPRTYDAARERTWSCSITRPAILAGLDGLYEVEAQRGRDLVAPLSGPRLSARLTVCCDDHKCWPCRLHCHHGDRARDQDP